MANCPNCGSSSITLAKKSNVNWGRAIGGYFLFGIVGGAVGAVTGNDRDVNACLDCGTTWRAQELYQSLQLVEKLSGRKFDLSKTIDREYLADFLNQLDNFNKQLEIQSKEFEKLIRKEKDNITENPMATQLSIAFSFICLVVGFFVKKEEMWGFVFFGFLLGLIAGVVMDILQRPSHIKRLEETKKQAEIMKQELQKEIQASLVKIAKKYNSNSF